MYRSILSVQTVVAVVLGARDRERPASHSWLACRLGHGSTSRLLHGLLAWAEGGLRGGFLCWLQRVSGPAGSSSGLGHRLARLGARLDRGLLGRARGTQRSAVLEVGSPFAERFKQTTLLVVHAP